MVRPHALTQWVETGVAARAGFAVSTSAVPHPAASVEVELRDNELLGIASLSESGALKLEACYPSSGNWIVLESHQPTSVGELHELLAAFLSNIRKA